MLARTGVFPEGASRLYMLMGVSGRVDMSQGQVAYNRIRDSVTYGELRLGERLVEERVCKLLEIGRTPPYQGGTRLAAEAKGIEITYTKHFQRDGMDSSIKHGQER